MQVTEILSEGLKRELKIVVAADDLESKLQDRLNELKSKVRIDGFRPGKVPLGHLRRLYGQSAMAELIEQTIGETSNKAVTDRSEKPAMQPKIELPENKEEVEAIMSGKADLAYTVSYEILPAIDIADVSGIAIERPVVDIEESEINETLERIANENRPFEARAEGEAAENGDRATIDFLGKLDGEPFEGGKGDDFPLVLGSNSFIPGFEEQVVGMKAGEEKVITVTFPEEYGAEHLAGKDATFDVKVKEVAAAGDAEINDEFATNLGLESLDKLKEAIKDQLTSQYGQATRQKVKRQLLDSLDELHQFELPPTLVDQEFENIWNSVKQEMEQQGRTFEDEETSEEDAKGDYRKIAERRVRLGLVLAEIGEKAEVQVSEQEVQQALVARVQQFPGQEQQVWDFYRNNPEALASLRAPVFEEKVVDHLMEKVTVTDKTVSKEELLAAVEEDEENA